MFVRREVSVRHWLGIFVIIVGLATVGVSDLLSSDSNDITVNKILIGNYNY